VLLRQHMLVRDATADGIIRNNRDFEATHPNGAAMRIFFKLLITASTFMGAATALTATAQTVERIRQTNTINLGFREASVPFSYVDANNKPIGYSIDICNALVESIKRELKLPNPKVNMVAVQAAERIPFVVEGKIDLECGNTTATAERRTKAAFTMPIFIAGTGVLARKQAGATKLTQLRGKNFVFVGGTTGEKVVNEANKQAYSLKSVTTKSNTDAFAALKDGKADAWITDDVLLASFRAGADKPDDFVLLDQRHTIEPLAIMMRLNDSAFEDMIDRALARMVREDKLQSLYTKWFTQPIPPKNINLNLPPSRLLREYFRSPTKSVSNVDVILL
jgi:ABC-type amino acid transport substrate-binding protein